MLSCQSALVQCLVQSMLHHEQWLLCDLHDILLYTISNTNHTVVTWTVLSNLSTDNLCISSCPWTITNGSPLLIHTYLHSTLSIVHSSNQSDLSSVAIVCAQEIHRIQSDNVRLLFIPDAWQLTPASSLCPQLSIVRWLHCCNTYSFPEHCTLSYSMGPVPWPKNALVYAVAPVKLKNCKLMLKVILSHTYQQ